MIPYTLVLISDSAILDRGLECNSKKTHFHKKNIQIYILNTKDIKCCSLIDDIYLVNRYKLYLEYVTNQI